MAQRNIPVNDIIQDYWMRTKGWNPSGWWSKSMGEWRKISDPGWMMASWREWMKRLKASRWGLKTREQECWTGSLSSTVKMNMRIRLLQEAAAATARRRYRVEAPGKTTISGSASNVVGYNSKVTMWLLTMYVFWRIRRCPRSQHLPLASILDLNELTFDTKGSYKSCKLWEQDIAAEVIVHLMGGKATKTPWQKPIGTTNRKPHQQCDYPDI